MEELTRRVQAAVVGTERRKPYDNGGHPLSGHCYVASEALYYLRAGALGFKPQVVRHGTGTHWYLRRGDEVLDPTADQFTDAVPYDKGRGCGFLTKGPSKRAKIIIKQCL